MEFSRAVTDAKLSISFLKMPKQLCASTYLHSHGLQFKPT